MQPLQDFKRLISAKDAAPGRRGVCISARAATLFVLPLALAGCAPQAAILDIEEDKVLVRATGDEDALAAQEAQRGCGVYGRTAVALSAWCLDAVCSRADYLFACRE